MKFNSNVNMLILCLIFSICILGVTIIYLIKYYSILFLIALIINIIAILIVLICLILEIRNKE